MEFLSDPYRVMVVTASESFDTETRALLPPSEFYPVTSVHAVGEARRRLVSEAFDIVVVNSPLPDETGLEFALDLCATPATAAVAIVSRLVYEDMRTRAEAGGLLLLPRPLSKPAFLQMMRVACTLCGRLRRLVGQQKSMEERMDGIRLINRAKWKLIAERGMTEEEAHRYLSRTAMNERISRQELAGRILGEASGSGP